MHSFRRAVFLGLGVAKSFRGLAREKEHAHSITVPQRLPQ
jgi:hypothetical protein